MDGPTDGRVGGRIATDNKVVLILLCLWFQQRFAFFEGESFCIPS